MRRTRLLSMLVVASTFAALGLAAGTGCSAGSDDTVLPAPDTGPRDTGMVDTAVPDTNPGDTYDGGGPKPVDAPPPDADAGPPVCDQDLPTDFACASPTKLGKPSTACSEAQLQAFAKTCLSDPSKIPLGCTDWKTTNAACSTCIESFALDSVATKNIPDRDKCYWVIFDAACDKAVNCSFDCQRTVCTDCDTTAGSGADGKKSEFQDCTTRAMYAGSSTKPKGRCYDIAVKEAKTCFATYDITPCIIDELYTPTGAGGKIDVPTLQAQTVQYLRGACRDNGNWTNYLSPTPLGSDAGSGG